ncbi:BrnA antitoxin family protein [Novosphingobium lentum]|uniref:BrnA antitoxin family protein n=1 Tax=Novosphingobium lentum TaxID=145287 RepID=UPI00083175B3|nr:BrnA antitoxin family protein [Novosphingobium lentum]
MNESTKPDSEPWIDPDDDYIEWTEEMFRIAAIYKGDQLIRPAAGTLKSLGRPLSENPKKQVTLRLDPDVIERFRATGKGWQSRINAELRKVLGLQDKA